VLLVHFLNILIRISQLPDSAFRWQHESRICFAAFS